MAITFYLNSWNYPHTALHVQFAASIVKKTTKQIVREFISQRFYNMAELKTFTEQVRENNAIVFHGGDTPTLLNYLKVKRDWMEHLDGKTLYGFSAGISAMAYRSFNIDHKRIVDGLRLFPFQTIVHYRPDMKYMVDELYRGCKLPVLVIPDSNSYRITTDGMRYTLEELNEKFYY